MSTVRTLFPFLRWLSAYRWREDGWQDALAACIVTAMLIPQSLSYALLAGMPVQTGLYASILPLLFYAVFGTSSTMSVGPMAVTSLISASVIAATGQRLHVDAPTVAAAFAVITGSFLMLMSILRLGFLAKLMSAPVLAGFNNASVLVIIWPQLWQLADLKTSQLSAQAFHPAALCIGLAAFDLLWLGKTHLPDLLARIMPKRHAANLSKAVPLLVLILAGLASRLTGLEHDSLQLKTIGSIPPGLPHLNLPQAPWPVWQALLLPSFFMALVVYVSAISVGQVLAAKRGEKIEPNQELLALGAANIASGISGAFPVTGGFSRSAVSYEAGARTQLAAVFTAMMMAAAIGWFSHWFAPLPQTALAAIVLISVASMFDRTIFRRLWQYRRSEWGVMMITFFATLFWRVDAGIGLGMLASFVLSISQSIQPHMAEIGRLKRSESFRNVLNHEVETWPTILSLRVDENLQFFNQEYFVETVWNKLAERTAVRHVIIQCHAINAIDFSAAEALTKLNRQLAERGIALHLSEVKQPVRRQLDQLAHHLPPERIHLSHHQAVESILAGQRTWYAEI